MTVNYDDFIELQSRYPRKISNDFMVPAEIKKRIEHDSLSLIADERALFIFERREGFSKLHFRITDTGAGLPPHDGTLAAYLTYRDGRYPKAAADWLQGQNFRYVKTLLRHTAKGITGELSEEDVENAGADDVYSMIGEHFSAVEADLPPRELFETAKTYCKRSPEGKLLGLVYDMGQTRVVAVSKQARGKGLGRRLYMSYATEKIRENNDNVFHEWISPDNTASLSMFRALGFISDTTASDCYILTKEDK